MKMTSTKPYLIRAFYDWIVDNELTPYILISASYPGVQIPQEHIREGCMVLNISPAAIRGLLLENDRIVFTARFSGKTEQIFVPPNAVLEIYAKETGKGFVFTIEEAEDEDGSEDSTQDTVPEPNVSTKKPSLKLVKKSNDS